VVVGLLAKKPAVAGSGLLAKAGEDGFISWKEIGRIKSYADVQVITVMNRWRVVTRVYATDHFPQAMKIINRHVRS